MPPAEASITIDASRKIGQISPLVFGHFIEHVRDHIEALWAEFLSNRAFAVDSPNTPGLPQPWTPVGAPMSAFACGILSPGERGLPRGVRIAAQPKAAGVAQLEIAIRQGVPLRASLVAKAEGTVEGIRVRLVCPQGGPLAEATLKEIGGDWKRFSAILTPSKGSQHAEFELTFQGTGALSVAAVSLMPTNAPAGVRAEVMHMARALRPRVLRYPGGCFADTYHWRDGIGPKDGRPILPNLQWGGIEPNDFGTDEFLRVCRALRCKPLLCVNVGSGTPEEAAQWVQYCNAPADTELGALRAKNGNPEPYNVRYWEIGNEIYGDWETGHCDAKTYAQKYLEFRKAMKAADPSIEMLAVGHTDMAWNREVLSAAGSEIEHITMHFYQGTPATADSATRYKAMLAAPLKFAKLIAEMEKVIGEVCKSHKPKIAITEWNAMYTRAAERTMTPREHTLEAALFNAGLLHVFLRHCQTMSICNFSDLVNGWAGGCIRLGDFVADAADRRVEGWSGVRKDIVYGTPTFYVLEAYATHVGQHLIGSQVDVGAYSSPECGDIPAFPTVPLLDVVATLDEGATELAIFLVNRERVLDVAARFAIANFRPARIANVFVVTGDGPDDRNTPRYPDAVDMVRMHVSDVGTTFEYEIAPCSATVILLRKAEAE